MGKGPLIISSVSVVQEHPINLEQLSMLYTSDVFEYVKECNTYDEVFDTLNKLYVKTPNTCSLPISDSQKKLGESNWWILGRIIEAQ